MPRMKSAPNSPDTTLESAAWLRKSPSGWLDRSKAREICQSANNVHGRRSTSDTTKKRKPMAKVEKAQRHPWSRAAMRTRRRRRTISPAMKTDTEKHGRTSGRKRVCQYMEITVGADYIKKKR